MVVSGIHYPCIIICVHFKHVQTRLLLHCKMCVAQCLTVDVSLSVSLQGRLRCGTGYWWEPQHSSLW